MRFQPQANESVPSTTRILFRWDCVGVCLRFRGASVKLDYFVSGGSSYKYGSVEYSFLELASVFIVNYLLFGECKYMKALTFRNALYLPLTMYIKPVWL